MDSSYVNRSIAINWKLMTSKHKQSIYQAQTLPFGGKIKITGTAVKEML